MRFIQPLALAGILAIGALGFVACSSDDKPSVEEAQASLCADLDTFKTAQQSLAALNAESTVEQFKAARSDVADAWSDVKSSAADVSDAKIDDLEAAYGDLSAAIDDVDDDKSLAAAISEVEPQLAAVGTAWTQYYSKAGCLAVPAKTEAATAAPGTTPTGAILKTVVSATETAAAGVAAAQTATMAAAVPEVKTAIAGTAVAGTATASAAGAAQTATVVAAVPEVKTAIAGTAVAAATATAEAQAPTEEPAATGTAIPQ